jgi:hypothetical protein
MQTQRDFDTPVEDAMPASNLHRFARLIARLA